MLVPAGNVIATILRHEDKTTSYKIALVRAINDVALSFPNIAVTDHDVAIPLRLLAEFWVAYYWPFVDAQVPILQGQLSSRNGIQRQDIRFRNHLTAFRALWESATGGVSAAADGFYVINELRVPRRRATYSVELRRAYDRTLDAIVEAVERPIHYAGPGEWSIFARPTRLARIDPRTIAIPGAVPADRCLVIPSGLWRTFREMALWVDALCIHQWCLYTEAISRGTTNRFDRGHVYRILTDQPGSRRPLTWERHQVDLLMREGATFTCPWTEKQIDAQTDYDLDHLMPVALRPINELWNLIPSDPYFNSHIKRERLPSPSRLTRAFPHLAATYDRYDQTPLLARAIHEDVSVRFAAIPQDHEQFPTAVAQAATDFIEQIAIARNLARF